MGTVKDITGETFGLWYVESFDRLDEHRARFNVRCRCGTRRSVLAQSLRKGDSTSCGCSFRLPQYEASCNGLLRVYKSGAQRRKLEFSLTVEQFRALTSGLCHYCGGEPSSVFRSPKGYNGAYVYNGIDRLDNCQGYTLGNCVTCCKVCNRMKYVMTPGEFLAQCAKIVNHVRVDG